MLFQREQLPVEFRNSEGISFADGAYVLSAALDTSGHANHESEGHLAYLLTEVWLNVMGHKLEPGVYAIGVDDRHRFIMMDIAAHRMFAVDSENDRDLPRPRPLQIRPSSEGQGYRLYLERNYISFYRVHRPTK